MELLAQVHAFQREYNDERRICKVTHIETNGYYNAVPDRITFFLSFRSADEEANRSGYAQLLHRMQHNGSVRSVLWNRVVSEYPAYANDPILAERIRGLLGKRFGQESVLNSPFLFSSDDFAFYARDLPGLRTCYFFIGAYIREHNAVHTASFDIGEEALLYGYESLRAIVRMFEQAEERAERIRLYETGSENDESIPLYIYRETHFPLRRVSHYLGDLAERYAEAKARATRLEPRVKEVIEEMEHEIAGIAEDHDRMEAIRFKRDFLMPGLRPQAATSG